MAFPSGMKPMAHLQVPLTQRENDAAHIRLESDKEQFSFKNKPDNFELNVAVQPLFDRMKPYGLKDLIPLPLQVLVQPCE